MGLTSAISNANSGLSAASRRAGLVSSNIANALTPGYVRRDLSVSENVAGGIGAGVKVSGVSRAIDPAITNDRRVADGMAQRDQLISTAYATLSNALGDPADPYSLFAQYESFETALRSLSQTPESQPMQSQVLDAANALVFGFQQLSVQAQTMRQNADSEIARQVSFVNDAVKQIESLNNQISTGGSGGRDVAALEDQRKVLIDQVAAIIPVREVARDYGKVDLITNEGVFLLAGKARPIEFTPANIVTADATLANGALSGLTVAGADITPGGGSQAIQQGALAGLFETRDRVGVDFQTKIDGLARDMIERFEGIDPTLAVGAPGLFTDAGAAFDPANEAGLASRITLNAAVDPAQGGSLWRLRDGLGAAGEGAAGNGDLLTVLLDALTEMKSIPAGAGVEGQKTAASAVADVSSLIGAARMTAETRLAANMARAQSLEEAELAVTSVDTDLEMQKLLIIEQAFAANARVIQTADEMLRTLLEI